MATCMDVCWYMCKSGVLQGISVHNTTSMASPPLWSTAVLSKKLCRAESGKLYVGSKGFIVVSWLDDLSAQHSAKYIRFVGDFNGRKDPTVKIYKFEVAKSGQSLFWQTRDIQDRMEFQ